MAVRPIDGKALEKKIGEWVGQPGNGDYYSGYDAALCAVQDLIADMPTLTPPNEWGSRVRELDELYTKLQAVTGFTVEQLLEMFLAGYTLGKPDYSNHFAEMESLAETAPPNTPLTLDELREMDGEPVWVQDLEEPEKSQWRLLYWDRGKYLVLQGISVRGYLLEEYGERWLAYRRPMEKK